MNGKIAKKKLNATAEARIESAPLNKPLKKNTNTSYRGNPWNPGILSKRRFRLMASRNCTYCRSRLLFINAFIESWFRLESL